jgi:hypothetical protein
MPIPGRTDLTPQRMWRLVGGLKADDDATNIHESQTPDCYNVAFDKGVMVKRDGFYPALATHSEEITNILTSNTWSGSVYILAVGPTHVVNWNGTSWDELNTATPYTGTTTGFPTCCDFLNNWYFVKSGETNLRVWDHSGTLDLVTNADPALEPPPAPLTIEAFKNHLFIFGTSADYQKVYWSNYGVGDDWGGGSSGYTSLVEDGFPIIRGIATEEVVFIFKRQSIYIMRYIGYPAWFGFFRLITSDGCVSPSAMVRVENHVYFLGYNGFYRLSLQSGLENIGVPIFDEIKARTTNTHGSYVIWDRVREKIVLFLLGTSGFFDTYYEYDYLRNIWSKGGFSASFIAEASPMCANSFVILQGTAWSSLIEPWTSYSQSWASFGYLSPVTFLSGGLYKTFQWKLTTTQDGSYPYTAYWKSKKFFTSELTGEVQRLEVYGDGLVVASIGQGENTEELEFSSPVALDLTDSKRGVLDIKITGRVFQIKLSCDYAGRTMAVKGVTAWIRTRGDK